MIRPGRGRRYSATAGSTGSDTDALQTDVMRFLSILGLCLMAVFALVQSIPLQETAPVRPDPEREDLRRDIAVLQQHARDLETELNGLMTQIEQAQASKADAEQALSAAQRELDQVVEQTQEARSEQQHLRVQLDRLRQQLAQGRYALATLHQATDDKTQSLRTLQQRLDEQRQKLDDIRQRALEVAMAQSSKPAPPAVANRPPAASATVKKGFTLRFASAEALERLVAAGTVSLYAMADKQAWRLSLPRGRPVFSNETFPSWFHEMAASTVPAGYVRELGNTMGTTAGSSIVWGVQLPPATKRSIASLTRDRQGGNLVIAADGDVTLAAE